MSDRARKLAILAAFRPAPDFSALQVLPSIHGSPGVRFLRWLDRSGLALGFYRRLADLGELSLLSKEWRYALEERYEANQRRTADMLDEVRRLLDALNAHGVVAVCLKGFTLVPDFSEDINVRHQTDFDFLIDSSEVRASAKALDSCGYSASRLNDSGESCFTTPLTHIPSTSDNLYEVQRQRQVDLHTSIWEPCSWLPVAAPQDCLAHIESRSSYGVEHRSLCLEDKFLLQVFHAFRHSFRSWIRLSWLWEIGVCLRNHWGNVELWRRVTHRAGNTLLTKRIFALVLGLSERLFGGAIPPELAQWSSVSMTHSLRTWLDHFATDWAISDWPGSLSNLFLTAAFIPDPTLQRLYWRSRVLPRGNSTSIGHVANANLLQTVRANAARWYYVTNRARAHLKDIVAFPRQRLRWKRALLS